MNRRSTIALHTGRKMPVVGLGTWELTRATSDTILHALRLGYRMIDTAVDYGSQPGIGEALAHTEIPREDVFLVAKVEEDDDAFNATLRYLEEMRQDYADLMLIHRPPTDGIGLELWDSLVRAREDGFTREIGVSNYSTRQLKQLIDATGEVPVVNQIESTPFGWSQDMLDECGRRGIVVQAYSPLTRADRLDDETLGRVAADYDRTPAQVLLRWALQKSTVPLPKANRKDHLKENLGALDFRIDDIHMDELDRLNQQYSSLGSRPEYL